MVKEIMSLSHADFLHVAQFICDKPVEWIASTPRELVVADAATRGNNGAWILAAMDLLYEYSPDRGSGAIFHALKAPSQYATSIGHRGFDVEIDVG
jgi:hypothetical protein